jgi:hypothetical protein
MHKQIFTCALLLLVRQNLTSKSDAQAMHKQIFTCALLLLVRQNLTSKSDAQANFHMCTTFAGSSKFNQQK